MSALSHRRFCLLLPFAVLLGCPTTVGVESGDACNDGVDNDADGTADCADVDCMSHPECQGDDDDATGDDDDATGDDDDATGDDDDATGDDDDATGDDDDSTGDDDDATGDDDDSTGDDDDDSAVGDDDDSAVGDDDDSPALTDSDRDGFFAEIDDCNDDDPAIYPGVLPTLSLSGSAPSWFHWGGAELPPPAFLTLEIGDDGCADIAVGSDAPWLQAVHDEESGTLLLLLREEGAESGRHTGTVSIVDDLSGGVLETVEVSLSALVAAPEPAPRHVLVIGGDGVRGDALQEAETPVFDLLSEGAAWTYSAAPQSTAPTNSGPGWTSLLTGVQPSKHLVTSNGGYDDRDTAFPSFLWRAKTELGLSTAAAIHWADIFDILEPEILDSTASGGDAGVTSAMADILRTEDRQVHFVHLDDPDAVGHGSGFSPVNPAYIAALELLDMQMGALFDAVLDRPTVASENWLIVFSTDHGGEGYGHGGAPSWPDEANQIPILFAGPTLPARGYMGLEGSHTDIHPTVMAFLGAFPEDSWGLDGSVVGFVESDCGDGIDGDSDGATDCDDPDCADDIACLPCPEMDAGSAVGFSIASGTVPSREGMLSGSCGGGAAPEVALSWTAPSEDLWTFDLSGSDRNYDTVLYALASTCDGAELACNDDASDMQSAVQVPLDAGETVVLVVDGFDAGGSGSFVLNAEPLGACPDADLGSSVGEAVATGSILEQGATFFASCARSGRDALLTWTAPFEGTFTFDTGGSDYDTVLHIRDGSCSGEELACNDDGLAGYLSEVSVALLEGQTVTVVVSGFNGRPEEPGTPACCGGGNYVLNITAPLL